MSAGDAEDITQLVLRERQSRDRGWWDRWSDCFADDSFIDMSWFRGSGADWVRQTRQRSTHGVWGRHRLSASTVQVNGDRGWAEQPLGIEFRTTVGDVEALLVSYCRSQYRTVRVEGTWKIVRITSIYERDSLTPSVPGTTLDLDPAHLTGYRPSYRCLAWYFAQQGVDLGPDLLGDDRPEPVARQYRAEFAWLDGTSSSTTDSGSTDSKEH